MGQIRSDIESGAALEEPAKLRHQIGLGGLGRLRLSVVSKFASIISITFMIMVIIIISITIMIISITIMIISITIMIMVIIVARICYWRCCRKACGIGIREGQSSQLFIEWRGF